MVRTQHSQCQGSRFNPSKELRSRQGKKMRGERGEERLEDQAPARSWQNLQVLLESLYFILRMIRSHWRVLSRGIAWQLYIIEILLKLQCEDRRMRSYCSSWEKTMAKMMDRSEWTEDTVGRLFDGCEREESRITFRIRRLWASYGATLWDREYSLEDGMLWNIQVVMSERP